MKLHVQNDLLYRLVTSIGLPDVTELDPLLEKHADDIQGTTSGINTEWKLLSRS